MPGARLSAEGYRFLALLALRHHGRMTKGRLAWEIRANHPMATKVLRMLVEDRLASVERQADGAYAIIASEALAGHLTRHGPTLAHLFKAQLDRHFRFGKLPSWAKPERGWTS